MTAHYLPGDDRDERAAALYGQPETDDQPDPADYAGESVPMEPLWPVEEREAETWGDALCPRCQRNELQWWDVICGECQQERLEEEGQERALRGEWQWPL